MKRSFFVLILLFVFASAGANAQPKGEFPYPNPPAYLGDESAIVEWATLHFWDQYTFSECDTKYGLEINQRAFATFVSMLYSTSPTHAIEAIGAMMDRAAVSEEGYWYFLEMAEEVLYDPLSPMCDDLLWEPFVRHAIGEQSPLDEHSKARYRSLIRLVSRNQQGSVATDFVYTLADGSQGKMHDISAPYLLIFFYNPDCAECAHAKALFKSSGYLDMLHERGLMEVLALYPDEDISAWRKALPENPEWWISAYDKGQKINHEGLYDLKATPTLYLLDSQKRVIMKDPTAETLLSLLAGL